MVKNREVEKMRGNGKIYPRSVETIERKRRYRFIVTKDISKKIKSLLKQSHLKTLKKLKRNINQQINFGKSMEKIFKKFKEEYSTLKTLQMINIAISCAAGSLKKFEALYLKNFQYLKIISI